MHNVLLGICSGGTVQAETVTSLVAAIELVKDKGLGVNLTIQVGGYVAHNRNVLVKQAQEKGATHLMFVDADMIFPASGIVRLFDHDKDIVGGMYNTRGTLNDRGELVSTVKMANEKGEPIAVDSVPSQLFKCHAVATGFMLIKMSVFDNPKLSKPYFVAWEDEGGEHHTEDVQFCINAHKAGYDIWCSPTIRIGHKGQKIY